MSHWQLHWLSIFLPKQTHVQHWLDYETKLCSKKNNCYLNTHQKGKIYNTKKRKNNKKVRLEYDGFWWTKHLIQRQGIFAKHFSATLWSKSVSIVIWQKKLYQDGSLCILVYRNAKHYMPKTNNIMAQWLVDFTMS